MYNHIRVDLETMAIKGYSAFPKAPALFSVISPTLLGGCSSAVTQSTGLQLIYI